MTRVWIGLASVLVLAAGGAALASDWPGWVAAVVVVAAVVLSYGVARAATPSAGSDDNG